MTLKVRRSSSGERSAVLLDDDRHCLPQYDLHRHRASWTAAVARSLPLYAAASYLRRCRLPRSHRTNWTHPRIYRYFHFRWKWKMEYTDPFASNYNYRDLPFHRRFWMTFRLTYLLEFLKCRNDIFIFYIQWEMIVHLYRHKFFVVSGNQNNCIYTA